MKHVKWIFVVLLLGSLTSFVGKDKSTGGLNVGDVAPDFTLRNQTADDTRADLSQLKGRPVLISFWASYDGRSRLQNASLAAVLRNSPNNNVEMVSVSFDEYRSVFTETIRKDQIAAICLHEEAGNHSEIYRSYRLNRGFGNYLLDEKGVIIAKNITADELTEYLN